MLIYEVKRTSGSDCVVALIKHKITRKYHFVNLTKEHICPCEFDTIEDALLDLDDYKDRGIVKSYRKIGDINLKDKIYGED